MEYLFLLLTLALKSVKVVRRLIRPTSPVVRWACPVALPRAVEVDRDDISIWVAMLAGGVSHECATMWARHYYGQR
jgi:hypothetical protein